MKVGNYRINPYAVVATFVYPDEENPTLVNIYVYGMQESLQFKIDTNYESFQEALAFSKALEPTWKMPESYISTTSTKEDKYSDALNEGSERDWSKEQR